MINETIQLKDITPEQEDQFALYYKLLIAGNEKMNLTAITEETAVYVKHFQDSIAARGLFAAGASLCDVGSGAGFPGVPLKIVRPDLEVVLLDSLNKRVNFLNGVIDALGLKGITAVHARAEEFAHGKNRESFDCAVSRAVAQTRTLAEYCLPLVKVGGSFIAYKTAGIEGELKEAANAVRILGGAKSEIVGYELTAAFAKKSFFTEGNNIAPPRPVKGASVGTSPAESKLGRLPLLSEEKSKIDSGGEAETLSRVLVVIKKAALSPIKYPRAGNKPRLQPL